jgi:lysophospholipase L1-like esterase
MTQGLATTNQEPLAAQEPRPRAGKALRVLARDALFILLVGGIAEGGLCLIKGPWGDRPQLYDADYTGGKLCAVNADGLRGPRVQGKRPGELRILGVGDSTTFGTGVGWDEAWPHQAALSLGSALKREVTGINTGSPAASLKEIAYAIDHAWGDLQPDAVVLMSSGNQVSLAWIRRDEEGSMPAQASPPPPSLAYRVSTALNRAVKYLRLPDLLTQASERATYAIGLHNHTIQPDAPFGAMLAHGWKQPGLDPNLAEQAWHMFEQDLALLRDRVRARGARFYVAALPARFMLNDRPENNEKHVPLHRLSMVPGDRVREMCERLGIANIDLTKPLQDALGPQNPSPYVPMDYTHLSRYGHQVVAGAIAQRLANDK